MKFSKGILEIVPAEEIPPISRFIFEMTSKRFKRRGAVVGLSGGVDSSVIAELLVRSLGKERVLGLLLPEKESSPASLEQGLAQARKLEIETVVTDITEHLEVLGVYRERDVVIRGIFPEFYEGCRFHVTLPQDLLGKNRINYHIITLETPDGERQTKTLSAEEWLRISACQNLKQRTRMLQLYYHAEKRNYLVSGTTNKTEAGQGFFVKFGDGAADIEPIAHLYKTQVYQLARSMGVIDAIVRRPPSPDTYSLPVTDKEFYFCLDYELLDLLLYAYQNNVNCNDIVPVLGLDQDQIKRAFRDFKAKEEATWHLRQLPMSL